MTMVGDRMRQKLSVGLSIFVLNLLCLNSFLYNNPKLCGFCYTLLLSPDLLVTAEEPRRQTRDTEMLLEATLAWTMSNVRWIQLQSHGFCQGHEDKLTDCQYASYDDCEASEAAGVVCEVDGMFVCILYIYVFQYC